MPVEPDAMNTIMHVYAGTYVILRCSITFFKVNLVVPESTGKDYFESRSITLVLVIFFSLERQPSSKFKYIKITET